MKKKRKIKSFLWNLDNIGNSGRVQLVSVTASVLTAIVTLCGALPLLSSANQALNNWNTFVQANYIQDIDTQNNDVENTVNFSGNGDVTVNNYFITKTAVMNPLSYSKAPTEWKNTTFDTLYNSDNVEISAKELAGSRVRVDYQEDGYDVVFVGCINQSGQWDEECNIFLFKDGKFETLTKATYMYGNLLKYQQIDMEYDEDSQMFVWSMQNRCPQGEYNVGTTGKYFLEKQYTRDDLEQIIDITAKDVINDLANILCKKMAAFYFGTTKDGCFEDETGNAYYISYDKESGLILTLYVGHFSEGTFNDFTGNAWEIARNPSGQYVYYNGPFKDGKSLYKDKSELITFEEMERIISGYNFDSNLYWDKDAFIVKKES